MNQIPFDSQVKALGPEWGWTVRYSPAGTKPALFLVNFHKVPHFFPVYSNTISAAAAESFRRATLWQKEGVK